MRRFRRLIALAVAAALTPMSLLAQEAATVTGRVTNQQGQPESAVLVRIESLNVGTTTGPDGTYRLVVPGARVPSGAVQIAASRQGLATQSASVALRPGAAVTQNFTMTPAAILLEGVVVSALGIERERSQLGTAQQQISTEELNVTRPQSVVNQMQGKVSGVQIAGGIQGGSNYVVIRGGSSITGNNSPLFIVDGIPVSNRSRATTTGSYVGGGSANVNLLGNGYDYGNAISDLNPEDIATLTVLKGPNAAAIYGSRAANGAIVITTKRGAAAAATGRIQTELTTTISRERPSHLPDFQNQYGQGSAGAYAITADQSWGPRLDAGLLICQFDSPRDANGVCQPTPWVSQPNNVSDFFDTGTSIATTLAASGGTERANARLSLGYDNVAGYVPNNSFTKYSALLNAGVQVTSRLNATASAQYFRNEGLNRPGTGYNGSIMQQFFWFGRQVNINNLRDYQRGGAANGGPVTREYNWNYNYHNNPFWIQYENQIEDRRDRFVLSGTASYELAEGVNATLRSGSDIFSFNAQQQYPRGRLGAAFTDQNFNGGFVLIDDYSNEHNSELLLTANRDLNSSIAINALAGAGIRREYLTVRTAQTTGILVPGLYNLSNAAITPTLAQFLNERHVNSAFGSLSATYNNWLTVEGTARNDWSSTLPRGANSYFYPSLSTSLVLTEALPGLRSNALSFVKLRGSIAQVGSDAAPYQLQTVYLGNPTQFNGQSQFSLSNVLANQQLKPEITTSTEGGVELEFFHGRAILDATVYHKSTRDQVMQVSIAPTSGFTAQSINAGRLDNKGFEALLSVTPVDLANGFRWNTTFNFARNRSEVVELYPGVDAIVLGQGLWAEARIESRPGRPAQGIYANLFARDSATGKLLTSGGMPFTDNANPHQYVGTVQPDWTGGWNNELTFRNMSFGFLFDIKQGGKVVSYTNKIGNYSGVLASSLLGRETDYESPGILVDGIDVVTGAQNTIRVSPEDYFQAGSWFYTVEPYIYDASYVKLREVRLGFDLPQRWTGRLNTQNINIALTGRNLLTWTDVPNVDPEFAYSSGNVQGLEYAIPATPRSIGVSVRIRP
jgi:TonB-linked SusC/RagA family outer membrane protein